MRVHANESSQWVPFHPHSANKMVPQCSLHVSHNSRRCFLLIPAVNLNQLSNYLRQSRVAQLFSFLPSSSFFPSSTRFFFPLLFPLFCVSAVIPIFAFVFFSRPWKLFFLIHPVSLYFVSSFHLFTHQDGHLSPVYLPTFSPSNRCTYIQHRIFWDLGFKVRSH